MRAMAPEEMEAAQRIEAAKAYAAQDIRGALLQLSKADLRRRPNPLWI
jgi:hypothetical protein